MSIESQASEQNLTTDDVAMEVDTPMDESAAKFQKDLWQLKLLPYHDELTRDADTFFSHIKTGLAHSVLHRDARPGFIYWVHELDRYMQLYNRRFTKQDHLSLVNLLYKALTLENLDFRVVKLTANTIKTLLDRKNLLNREDLQLDWRPLYDLYIEIAYKNLEEDGIFLLPEGLKKTVEAAIMECNHYFLDSATQEILDEVRPYVCPWDDSMGRALNIMYLFLPTSLDMATHDICGASLWMEELWHWFTSVECCSQMDEKILAIFHRLVKDCPGYMDWSDKYDVLFSRLVRSFKLEVGSERVQLSGNSHICGYIALIIAYTLGGPSDGCQSHLKQLFQSTQSYFHPSNSGSHTANLINFIIKLSTFVMQRISRERHQPNKYVNLVPPEMQLTNIQLDAFVKSILPCLEFGAFAKVKQDIVPSIFRILSFLAPGIIIPFVLDLVYPALETLTEPHRLIQSLHILACTCVALVRDDPTKSSGERLPIKFLDLEPDSTNKSFRPHVITILNNILPGMDANDIAKSTLTFQIIAVLFLLVPIVDCSEAIGVRDDLTEEEKELCRASAGFDTFVEQLLCKMFAMIEMLGHAAPPTNSSDRNIMGKSRIKNYEELIIEKGVLTIFKALVKNCSTSIYKRVVDQFFEFLHETHMFDSRSAMDTVAQIITVLVDAKPTHAFPLFFSFCRDNLKKHLHEETFEEDEVDIAVIWYLTLLSETIRGAPGHIMLAHKQEIDQILSQITKFKNKDANFLAAVTLQNVLYSLTAIYPLMQDYHKEVLDQPFDKYLPIRHWAKTVHKDEWKLNWHIPSQGEVAYANEIMQKYLFGTLNSLNEVDKMDDKEILKNLVIVHFVIAGSSNLLPMFEEEIISIMPTVTPNISFATTAIPDSVSCLKSPDGKNLRKFVFERMKILAEYLLRSLENDTKSISELCTILRLLFLVRGVDRGSYDMQYNSFQHTKRILSDPVRGNIATIESIMEDTIVFMHARRQLARPLIAMTATHVEGLRLLVKIGTSHYSGVRIEAQKILDSLLSSIAYGYKVILDDVLYYLKEEHKVTHEQLKGALYILLNGKKTSICVRQDWESLIKIWPSVVKAQFSEKPSIVALLDSAQDIIVCNFESFQIKFEFPETIMSYAESLLEEYPGCIHKPVWDRPSDNEIKSSKQREDNLNQTNEQLYTQLCEELYSLSSDPTLHWRHADMAQSLLSLTLRRDAEFPEKAVKLFWNLLVSDSLKTRKMAFALVSSWMKINKPKAIKKFYQVPNQLPNTGPGAKWPIVYGIREDNKDLIYDVQKQPKTAAEWNQSRWYSKVHWGFYTWPKEFKTYGTVAEQTGVNRDHKDFTKLEKEIIEVITQDGYLDKLFALMSLEEKKGADQFNAVHFSLFYGLFRNFNDALLPHILPHLEKLYEVKKEGAQRLAAEITAGLINGSKLWYYEKLEPVWKWLAPKLEKNLETIITEAEKNWGTCMATIFGSCDPRVLGWLIELLFSLCKKPSDSSYHTTTRLYFLHCALNQCEWRVIEQWRNLYDHCSKLTGQAHQNLRSRVGSCLSSTAMCDIRGIYISPNIDVRFKPITIDQVISIMNNQLGTLWQSVLSQAGKIPTLTPVPSSQSIANGQSDGLNSDIEFLDSSGTLSPASSVSDLEIINGTNGHGSAKKKDKLTLITLVNTVYSLWGQSFKAMPEPIIELIPMFAHFANETMDEELKNSCNVQLVHAMGTSPVPIANAELVLDVSKNAAIRCSAWKAKTTLLKFLQVSIFANLYVFKPHADKVREIIVQLLSDPQLEVRMGAADTLSGFIHCSFLSVDKSLIEIITEWTNSPNPLRRHAGVLALQAVIRAFPYSVPSFLPGLLMTIIKHANEREPIRSTVKKALNEFKRTHQDMWQQHKQEFSEDQLAVLTSVLVSPNYYV